MRDEVLLLIPAQSLAHSKFSKKQRPNDLMRFELLPDWTPSTRTPALSLYTWHCWKWSETTPSSPTLTHSLERELSHGFWYMFKLQNAYLLVTWINTQRLKQHSASKHVYLYLCYTSEKGPSVFLPLCPSTPNNSSRINPAQRERHNYLGSDMRENCE